MKGAFQLLTGMSAEERGINMRVIDMHCDTIDRLLGEKDRGGPGVLRENECHLDLMRMKKSGYLLQNFALFVDQVREDRPWDRVCRLYDCYREELEKNKDLIAPVWRYSDIAVNDASGKISSLLTVEEGGVCGGDLGKLRRLYDMGVRMLTLTWNYPNELGDPNLDTERRREVRRLKKEWQELDPGCEEYREKQSQVQSAYEQMNHTPQTVRGLTERGREFVAEMEKMGMIPDVSHLSDAGFYQVLESTKKPFAASHSNARAVCSAVRNLTDHMIRKLADRGGVMGLNFCADFLEEVPVGMKNPGSMEAFVRHARHIVNVGGVEVLGLGSDFDGIDTNEALPGAQSMGLLWEGLRKAGFSEDALDLIFWKNVLRFYKDTL